jgi:CheY-like chemotaxis protein
LIIEVRDTGVGIESEALPRNFNAFEQGAARGARQFGGLGLGLAISRSNAEAHGGRLSASSAGPGLGATFALTLAAVPAPATLPRDSSGRFPHDPPRSTLRILLVEDNVDTLQVIAQLMRRHGHRVTAASSVGSALKAAARDEFDIVVSDIGLPDGSGLDLMRQLRTRGSTPGIALTGYGMEDDVRQSEAAGFAAHLTKPVCYATLEARIQQVAAGRRLHLVAACTDAPA